MYECAVGKAADAGTVALVNQRRTDEADHPMGSEKRADHWSLAVAESPDLDGLDCMAVVDIDVDMEGWPEADKAADIDLVDVNKGLGSDKEGGRNWLEEDNCEAAAEMEINLAAV